MNVNLLFILIGLVIIANAILTYVAIFHLYWTRRQDKVLERLGLLHEVDKLKNKVNHKE